MFKNKLYYLFEIHDEGLRIFEFENVDQVKKYFFEHISEDDFETVLNLSFIDGDSSSIFSLYYFNEGNLIPLINDKIEFVKGY